MTKRNPMAKFAAYDNFTIYAVGNTPAAAVSKACADTWEPEGLFSVAPISGELCTQIEREGWNGNRQSFAIDDSGYIVDTTNY